ncbi:uncharacterized protein LOC108675751, partial [Hyalella azteca]|uniref:Uncharacterized protein LOC108675751 n=1 Tax=Hyalella azteca TaxID=294128 RepID=A0A8B7NZY1_HYAAZ
MASTRVTTGADTPTNTLQDSISELRSSNSSLTSVTSRASFLSPLQPDIADDGSLVSSPPLSSRLTRSLKGRLTGALNYWTGTKERPSKDYPATPTCSPSGEEGAEEEGEKEQQFPMSPASGAPLVFPELQQNNQQLPQLPDDSANAASVHSLQPSPPELFAAL